MPHIAVVENGTVIAVIDNTDGEVIACDMNGKAEALGLVPGGKIDLDTDVPMHMQLSIDLVAASPVKPVQVFQRHGLYYVVDTGVIRHPDISSEGVIRVMAMYLK